MVGSGWKAVADFSGPMGASKGAKATREDLHVRGSEHSDCGSVLGQVCRLSLQVIDVVIEQA